MTKILFVCHGNICRSPMAEFIFKDMVKKNGKEDDFYIGRTEFDSPDVDGEVLITKTKQLTIGDFYQVKITESDMYDLYAEVL